MLDLSANPKIVQNGHNILPVNGPFYPGQPWMPLHGFLQIAVREVRLHSRDAGLERFGKMLCQQNQGYDDDQNESTTEMAADRFGRRSRLAMA